MAALPIDAEPLVPGRGCPLDYRYGPAALRDAPALAADVLWVAGGLYGNLDALGTLRGLVEAESRDARVEVVLNGDFHWFDAAAADFRAIASGIDGWHAMRGNVETELARPDTDGLDAGCGCGYPDSVPQDDVDRSNAMILRLRETARALGASEALGALPMLRRARVGALRVGLVHGDDRSLAGWRLAHDALAASRADGLDASFDAADVDAIACSHTCVPLADGFASALGGRPLAVINNGAAGMANFAGSTFGVATRIAAPGLPVPPGLRVLYRATLAGADVAAVAIDFDVARFLDRFDRTWPPGSPAERSYRTRIARGTTVPVGAAARGPFRIVG